jgi:DnaK suppressor protein
MNNVIFDIPTTFGYCTIEKNEVIGGMMPKQPNESELNVKTDAVSMGIAPYHEVEGEEYMNDKQLAHIEKILLAWRQSLMEEVDRTVTHMKDEAANFPDPSDRASQEEEFSLELRTRDRERKLIKKIEDALERLREEDFGYCEACGIEIGLKRLEARPTATLCIDCKTLAEIKERQNQGA